MNYYVVMDGLSARISPTVNADQSKGYPTTYPLTQHNPISEFIEYKKQTKFVAQDLTQVVDQKNLILHASFFTTI